MSLLKELYALNPVTTTTEDKFSDSGDGVGQTDGGMDGQQQGAQVVDPNKPVPDSDQPRVLATADKYKLTVDQNEQVTLSDDAGHPLVSMPLVIWRQLARS